LAKFSAHLENRRGEQVRTLQWWMQLGDAQRSRNRDEAAQFPLGDAAQRLIVVDQSLAIYHTLEHALSQSVWMWMNGASAHFYELDRQKAPPSLRELAALSLEIGHGRTDGPWTYEHVKQISALWERACLELDEQIGTTPDWGTW